MQKVLGLYNTHTGGGGRNGSLLTCDTRTFESAFKQALSMIAKRKKRERETDSTKVPAVGLIEP